MHGKSPGKEPVNGNRERTQRNPGKHREASEKPCEIHGNARFTRGNMSATEGAAAGPTTRERAHDQHVPGAGRSVSTF
ncbi:hypothetical protein SGPA1_30430 [Streptomyces misionensis JCM 4497]